MSVLACHERVDYSLVMVSWILRVQSSTCVNHVSLSTAEEDLVMYLHIQLTR